MVSGVPIRNAAPSTDPFEPPLLRISVQSVAMTCVPRYGMPLTQFGPVTIWK